MSFLHLKHSLCSRSGYYKGMKQGQHCWLLWAEVGLLQQHMRSYWRPLAMKEFKVCLWPNIVQNIPIHDSTTSAFQLNWRKAEFSSNLAFLWAAAFSRSDTLPLSPFILAVMFASWWLFYVTGRKKNIAILYDVKDIWGIQDVGDRARTSAERYCLKQLWKQNTNSLFSHKKWVRALFKDMTEKSKSTVTWRCPGEPLKVFLY